MDKKNCQQVFRQGELLFVKVKVPKEVDRAKIGEVLSTNVIREGEVSGHKHEVIGGTLQTLEHRSHWFENKEKTSGYGQDNYQLPEGQMFLKGDNTIEIRHPEHKSLKLAPGEYVIRIQREYEEGRDRLVSD
jgi:hypothetical protein